MRAGIQILRSVGHYLFVMAMIILLVLFPRTPQTTIQTFKLPDGRTVTSAVTSSSSYSLEGHWANIKNFFSQAIENKSLGQTRFNVTVEYEIFTSISNSLMIIIGALVISFFLGIMKGIFDFKVGRKKLSIFGNWTTWISQSIPDFFVILFIQWLLIRHFPITKFFERDGWDAFLLPALLVAIFPLMYIARITSTAIAGQVGQLYIQVARAKGISERMILYKHIFRNCISTILSHLSSLMVYILSNLLMVEYFMNYPGAANRLFLAIDYDPRYGTGMKYEPGLIIGITFFFMILILIVQIISHFSKRYFEPRVGGN